MTATREAPAFQLALEEDELPPLQSIVVGVAIGIAFYVILLGLSALVLLA